MLRCPECREIDIICSCGDIYKYWTITALEEQISIMQKVIERKKRICQICGKQKKLVQELMYIDFNGNKVITGYICEGCVK